MFKLSILLSFLLSTGSVNAGLTAEQILGEYWKAPHFGEAATQKTIKIELLTGRIIPNEITAPINTNIRFIFSNLSSNAHLIAIAENPEVLLSNKKFITFVAKEMKHYKQVPTAGHSHSHNSSSENTSESLVRTLDNQPTVFVKPNEQKEIIIRFKEKQELSFFCALDNHRLKGFLGKITVTD